LSGPDINESVDIIRRNGTPLLVKCPFCRKMTSRFFRRCTYCKKNITIKYCFEKEKKEIENAGTEKNS